MRDVNLESQMPKIVSRWAVVALVLFAAVPAHAQQESKHRGFWIGFGVGAGWNLTRNIGGETLAGGAGFLRLGGTPHERFLLGGELIGWVRESEDVTYSRGNGTLALLFYPSVSAGVFLKGGVGGATFTRSVTSGNTTTTTTDNGFGSTIGIGWDARVARNFYVTPSVDFLYQRVASEDNALLLITVGATWH